MGNRTVLSPGDTAATAVVHEPIDLLDTGLARIAEIHDGEVTVNQWLKKAIFLLFQQEKMTVQDVGPFTYVDKIPLKADFQTPWCSCCPGRVSAVG